MPLLGSNNNLDVTVTTRQQGSGVTDTEKQIASLGKTSEESTGKVGGLVGAVEGFASKLKTLGEYFISYQIVTEIENAFKAVVGGAGELEQTNMAFQSMIGNAQEANSVFGQLVQYANVTPFQSSQIESAARTLMGFGTAGQQTVDILKQLGDVVSVGGGDMQQLSLVTGQIFAQGKLRAQDMYQVINDGGAGLIRIMAENVGGMKNLTAEFDKGGIPAKQYFDAVQQAVSQGGFAFEGAQKQAQTLNGRMSTLADAAKLTGLALLGVKLDPVLGLQVQPGGLFDQMKNGIAGLTSALQGLQPKLQAVMPQFIAHIGSLAHQIGDVLGPPLHDLWTTIATQLIPALGDFWHNIIEPLIPVVGTTLVGALWLAVNVLNELLKIITPVINFMADHQGVVYALAGAFLALKAAMMLGAAFDAVKIGFATLQLITIPSFMATLSTMTAAWAAAFPIAGILADIALVGVAIKTVLDAFSAMSNAAAAAKRDKASIDSAHQQIVNLSKNGTPDQKARANKLLAEGYATGVSNFGGGMALVGEDGPEIVNLPQGSSVYTNAQSRSMARNSMSGKQVTINQYNTINTQFDMDVAARELGFRLAHA